MGAAAQGRSARSARCQAETGTSRPTCPAACVRAGSSGAPEEVSVTDWVGLHAVALVLERVVERVRMVAMDVRSTGVIRSPVHLDPVTTEDVPPVGGLRDDRVRLP